MTPEQVRLILGRDERPVEYDPAFYRDKRVLVTGGSGSIGELLAPILCDLGAGVVTTDIDNMDVTDEVKVVRSLTTVNPEIVFHLAAQKHAPDGEDLVAETVATNIDGTRNVLNHAARARVVMASTCKACMPETVYGATKLIAERMVLNAGGTVARLYNVVPAAGNVFEIWDSTPDPVPVTRCFRYFISLWEAVAALLLAAQLPPGRYSPDPGHWSYMPHVAERLGREHQMADARRGDRRAEPLHADNERLVPAGGLFRVEATHDLRVRAFV